MNRSDRQKSFVLLFIFFLAVIYVGVTLAGIEQYVGAKAMDAAKLGVIVVLCAIAYLSGREYFQFTGTTGVYVGAMCFLALYHLTELTEEFAAFQSVPLFGEISLAKRGFETILMIGCICLFLAGNILSVRKITEARRQLESHVHDLSESRKRYRHLLTHTVAGIWRNELRNPMPIDWPVEKQVDYLIDQDSLVEANDVAARMYGYDRAEEVVGKTIREIFAHDVEDARRSMRAWVESNYRLDGCEIQQHVKPGQTRWFLMLGQGIIEEGHLTGSWSTAIDITERKLAEQALRESEERLSLIYNTTTDVMFLLRVETEDRFRILSHNRAFDQLIPAASLEQHSIDGLTAEAFFRDILQLTPEEIAFRLSQHREAAQSKRVVRMELTTTLPSGLEFIHETTLYPVLNRTDECTHILAVIQNITERKRAEEAILRHQEQLRFLATELCIVEERERRRLATILHDDICQLLVSSKMVVDLETSGNASGRDAGDALEKIGTWLEQAMEQARDLTFDLSTPMLYELGLSKAIEEWLTEKIQNERGMSVRFIDQGVSEAIGEDVSAFVFRSIRELTFNVVKHAQADHLTVTLGQDDSRIVIEVIDDGIGFDPESINQGSSKGGYGLFSIKERLEYMGGEFSVDSDRTQGARIVLVVPSEMKGDPTHGNAYSAG